MSIRHEILPVLLAIAFSGIPPAVSAATLNTGVDGVALDRLFPDARFDPAIPTQESVTGVAPGVRPLTPAEVVRYFRTLADSSTNARIETYSTSHEGRPLVYLAVSDPDTVQDLERFREEHRRLMDPRDRSDDDDRRLAADAKAVAWIAYGIHGDELSSTDASAAVAYWLVAGLDDRARALRRDLVILIDPCENPDGRSRYLAQTTAFAHATANPDQEDLSHTSLWPWGRGNHYLFDLNRDWFTLVQPESRRSDVIATWLPQLMVDSHEMGPNATYLFPPPRHPANPHLPETLEPWAARFSEHQARALDARGYPYFTGEWNEEFFPGYGSSWASYHGAVGILYEMSRTSGTVVRKRGGTLRRFAEAVEHQVTSTVANLESLHANRTAVMQDMIAARREASRPLAGGPVSVWLFPSDPRRVSRFLRFADILRRQGIEVLRLSGTAVVAANARDIRTGAGFDVELPSGSLMVRIDQPSSALARVLLDPHVPMASAFLREEREYLERGKGSRLYDATAWSLPLLHGLAAYWSATLPSGEWVLGAAPVVSPQRTPLAPEFRSVILEGTSDSSRGALAELLQRGVSVRIAEKPFTVEGSSFERGAIVVRREGNRDDVARHLEEVIDRWTVSMVEVGTSRAEVGPDLGGSHFPVLVPPRVGVWSGMPVSPSGYGSVWHLLDVELGLRFSGLDLGRIGRTELERYNVLVFPPTITGPSDYLHAFGEHGVERLRNWIEAGGTAVGIGNGARFLASTELELTRARFRADALERYPPVVLGITAGEAEVAGRFRAVGLVAAGTAADGASDDDRRARPTTTSSSSGTPSPYDVAPVLGAGALPFTDASELGRKIQGEPVSLDTWLRGSLPPGDDRPDDDDRRAADERLRRFMPRGALLRTDLDVEFWLNWGLDDTATVWFRSSDTLVAEPPVRSAARFAAIDRLHLGGLLWPEAAGRIANTAYATREAVGRGQVILFADEPTFRGWMHETGRQFSNAVLYGPGLGTRWSAPW